MINKDYILRLAEQLGRELAILLRLREYNKQEEALIAIDDLLLKTVGLTSRFINSLPEETLLKTLSPLGKINVEAGLWIASLLQSEGEIYTELGAPKESYYRSLKALYLFLAIVLQEPIETSSTFYAAIRDLLKKLDEYELPAHVKRLLFGYYELMGQYAKAEDTLFDLLDETKGDRELLTQGQAFYQRLQTRNDADLQAGNLTHEEVAEGLAQLQRFAE